VVRVLALSALYPPHHFGGYELSCRDVLNRWQAQGHDIRVLTSDFRLTDVTTPAGEPVDRSLRLYWRDHELWSPHPFTRMRIERHNQRVLTTTIDEFQPDVVSVWHMAGMSFGLLSTVIDRDIPMVGVTCDDWLDFGPRYDAWSRLFLDRPRIGRVVQRLTGVPTRLPDLGARASYCFVSETTRRYAEDKSRWSFPISTVVWSGIEDDEFPLRDSTPPWRWRLLFVGRIATAKGLDTIIRALPQLPDEAQLTVVGRGDPRLQAELETLATGLGVGDRIHWTSAERSELHRFYADADAVVFAPRWREPFGLVPIEAMACGTPVVATGTGGSAEVCLDGVNCLLFPPDDVDALVATLTRLAGDAALRENLRRGGVATAAELSNDRLAAVLEQWHVRAASRFADGVPDDRRLMLARS
jgi:glycosyltransferase involved in cell wall biosynthesis